MVYDLTFKYLWYRTDETRSYFLTTRAWNTFEKLVMLQNMFKFTDNFLYWLDEQLADWDWETIAGMLHSMTIEELCEEWEIETEEDNEE